MKTTRVQFKGSSYFFAIVFVMFFAGCGKRDFKSYSFSQAAVVTPHFSSINANIIGPKCLSCHTNSKSLVGYTAVYRNVVPGDPKASRLYTEIENGDMPVLLPSLNDDEALAIYLWIQNGALND